MLRQHAGRFVTLALRAASNSADERDRHRRLRRPPAAARSCAPTGLVEALGATGTIARRARRRSRPTDRTARLARRRRARALHRRPDRGARAARVDARASSTTRSPARAALTRRGSSSTCRAQVPDGRCATTSRCSRCAFSPCCRGRCRRRRSGASPSTLFSRKRTSCSPSRLRTLSTIGDGAHDGRAERHADGQFQAGPGDDRHRHHAVAADEEAQRRMRERDAHRPRDGARRPRGSRATRSHRPTGARPPRPRLPRASNRVARPGTRRSRATV